MYLFCLEYTKSNVVKFLQDLEKIKDLDICFDEVPYKPLLLCNKTIDSNRLEFKRYHSLEE